MDEDDRILADMEYCGYINDGIKKENKIGEGPVETKLNCLGGFGWALPLAAGSGREPPGRESPGVNKNDGPAGGGPAGRSAGRPARLPKTYKNL